MDSALRPRDIQARIRAGETPEAVAQAAGTNVERVMTYADPVIAERQHVAQRAQRSSVRRSPGDPGGQGAGPAHATLAEAVDAHLRSRNVDPAVVEWDAWRREDGRWTVTGSFAVGDRQGTAQLSYDMRGSYVVLDNDDARWLIGDLPDAESPAESATEAATEPDELRARRRRLSAVREEELPLGDDAVELVRETPLEAFLDDSPASDDPALREQAATAAAAEPDEDVLRATPADEAAADHTAEIPGVEPPPRRPVNKRRGRASVPSWDEIMFGGGDQ